jgi:adenine phosphoribosyltransferase
MNTNFYKINISGLERNLPICRINDSLAIAAFIMFSDIELTIHSAKELLKKSKDFDIIITAESKGIPLAYEMSKQSGKNYILARKSKKLYMKEPVSIDVKSITTASTQTLYLDKKDGEMLTNKKVLIVDDVISTGGSLFCLEKLVEKMGGNISQKMAVLAEGDAANRTDIVYLEKLPLFSL